MLMNRRGGEVAMFKAGVNWGSQSMEEENDWD